MALAGVWGLSLVLNPRRAAESVARWNERWGGTAPNSEAKIHTAVFFVAGIVICSIVLYYFVIEYVQSWFAT